MKMTEERAEFRFVNLYSGSSGNSTYIRTPDVEILIDAGKSAKALRCALSDIGEDISNIGAIFVTHEHTDHVSALKVLLKNYRINIHTVKSCAAYIPLLPQSEGLVCTHAPCFSVRFNNTVVSSFVTSHDSVSSVGYRIDYDNGAEHRSYAVATDTGYVTDQMYEALLGCDAVMLEANHDIDMVRYGIYPEALKRRILSRRGHLSNSDCATFAKILAEQGTKRVMLAHISKENNDPELAKRVVCNALSGTDTEILVASQSLATVLI